MLLLLLAAQAAQVDPVERAAYLSCLDKRVVVLERSGERPRDVAAAAVEECHAKEPAFGGTTYTMKVREHLVTKYAAKVVAIRADKKR